MQEIATDCFHIDKNPGIEVAPSPAFFLIAKRVALS
jgi:hypothetical protein